MLRPAFRKAIENYFVKNPEKKKSEVVNHFVQQGIARRTIYSNITRLENNQGFYDKSRTGRPSKFTPEKLKELKRLANNRLGRSSRKLERKYSVTHKNILK